jgi:hypothetical protein
MPDWWSWLAIDECACTCRREQDGQPFQEPVTEAILAQNLKEEWPQYVVESSGKVDLEQDSRGSQLFFFLKREKPGFCIVVMHTAFY